VPDHFEFEQEQRDGLQLIRWLGDPEINGWRRDDLWGPDTPRFVAEYRMFAWAGLLYPALLGLVWRLTSGLARFALPEFDGVSECERLGRPYELVRWEYGIEWEQSDWRSRDRGFVAAQSHRTLPGTRTGGQPHFERFEGAALTRVSTWPELMSIIPLGDQANTICLFAIPPDEHAHARLRSVLRADQPPEVETVVASEDDMFVVITQEEEEPRLSSLLLAGRERLRSSFRAEAQELAHRIDAYLTATAAARTLEEWSAVVDQLADL
jgi:hypothetical protein